MPQCAFVSGEVNVERRSVDPYATSSVHFDFAYGSGPRWINVTPGQHNHVSFTLPDDAIHDDEDEGPWVGFFHEGTEDLVGDCWHRARDCRMSGFTWAASALPGPGTYDIMLVPCGGSAESPIGHKLSAVVEY